MKKIVLVLIKYSSLLVLVALASALAIPGVFVFILGFPMFLLVAAPVIYLVFYYSARETLRLSRIRVLIIDDDLGFQKAVYRKINPEKWNTEVLQTSYAAVKRLLDGQNYDLVMVRRMMPKLRGEELLNHLDFAIKKHNQRHPENPIKLPPVIFFKRPEAPTLKLLSSHFMSVLKTIEVASPEIFAEILNDTNLIHELRLQ